ncbi:PREDICTED: uncharacterized protein LOC106102687 [Papilio polytes]|uniref:uncharacterized protein LOC106102687 n=1 Tax=Papilio polytes TaxID=76194 RepID=UPI000675FFA7|nr:PREDICTED: uncharacterized protein LOC106102687 [Papilio polytes]
MILFIMSSLFLTVELSNDQRIRFSNNSFAIILPTILNVFFTSYASSGAGAGFCDLFRMAGQDNTTVLAGHDRISVAKEGSECSGSIEDNTIWAGCAHGLSFFLLNALISHCAGRRKVLSISILLVAAAAAFVIDNTGEPISGLIFFYIFLTTAMVFGVVSSYFVDLYPTSYR